MQDKRKTVWTKFRSCKIVAICGKRTVLNRACQEEVTDDKIYYRGGSERNHGGGICVFPEKCINCHDGFYANGGYCASKSFANKQTYLSL